MTSRFCAICTSERGPFSHHPVGRSDAMVLVCAACSEPAIVIGEVPLLRVMPTAPRKPTQPLKVRLDLADAQKSRRDRNREAGRCTNHPLTSKGKPHDPPVPGKTKCAACIEVHRRAR